MSTSSSSQRVRLRIGELSIDPLTFAQAIDEVDALVAAGQGGSVFTPNVDHVVNAQHHQAFRQAYAEASLSLVDGAPLVWASHLLKTALPEKISGSDLIWPLMQRAGQRQWRVFLLGGQQGAAKNAATKISERFAVNIVGMDDSRISLAPSADPDQAAVLGRIKEARPHLLLVALGSPKQELWIHQHAETLKPAVAVAIGAGLDFIAGHVKRAPRVLSQMGLEWLFRLIQEPKRLWRRYLINDPQFLFILMRTLKPTIGERLGLPRARRMR